MHSERGWCHLQNPHNQYNHKEKICIFWAQTLIRIIKFQFFYFKVLLINTTKIISTFVSCDKQF